MPAPFRSVRAIIFACLLSGAAQAADHPGCQMIKAATLPVEVTAGNRMLLPGQIAGEKVRFVVDTGAARTMLDNTVTKRFGVHPGQRQLHAFGAGGAFEAYLSTIPGVRIGDFEGGDMHLYVSSTHFLSDNVVGVFGEDFFENFDLDIDVAKSNMMLFHYHECAAEPVYWAENFSEADIRVVDQHILVTVAVNGVEARAVLDTGARWTWVSWPLARRLGLDENSPGMEIAGTGRGVDRHPLKFYRHRFSELKIGDEVIHNASLRILDLYHREFDHQSMERTQDSNWNDADLVLGMDFIRSHHIYVASQKGKMYFTWNGGSIFLPPKEDKQVSSSN